MPPSAACSPPTSPCSGPRPSPSLALLAPFGIFDEANPGLDLYAVPTAERMEHLFAKGVPEPFVDRFGHLGADEGPVARYLSDVAAASLLWPLGDRGQARRIHRVTCPTLVLWGDEDELLPVATSQRLGRSGRLRCRHRAGRRPSARMGRAGRGRHPASSPFLQSTGGVHESRRPSGVPLLPLLPVHPPARDHGDYESLWVDFPNSNYDPQTGHDLYTRYLSEMVLADRLGYDGARAQRAPQHAVLDEPGAEPDGGGADPADEGAISVFGTPPNLGYPNRLAEEYAMLDVMSGGRLRIAFPLGTGMEYWANSVNPATARARFRESIDVILRCWTEDGPQAYAGDFYTYRYLNPWPKPIQQPHPECYIVGTGSPETIELAAELGFGYSVVFIPTKAQLQRVRALP